MLEPVFEPVFEPEPSSPPPLAVTSLLHAGTAKDVAAKSRIEILFMGLLYWDVFSAWTHGSMAALKLSKFA